jgi:methyl-accepting chemotaxis protein
MEVQELATIVQKGFDELSARMQEGFAKVDVRFEQVDARFERVEARIVTVDDNVHLTRILVEQLTNDVKQVAEGVEIHHKQLERHIIDTDRQFDDIQSVFRNYRAARRKRTTGRAGPSR